MRYLFGLSLLLYFASANAQHFVTGKVFDSETREPLPFVNIAIHEKDFGTTTGIDGSFKLAANSSDSLDLSYVGYESLRIANSGDSTINIFLKPKSHDLDAVEVFAGENPAFRIIRRVVENADRNNPENLSSFQYKAYHKLFATAEGSFDSIQKKNVAAKFFEENYLFLNETYSERKFVRFRQDKETIIGNRMSGVKDPFFAVLGNQFQSFSFYKPQIHLIDQTYLNPIAPGTFSRYDFMLEETRVTANDTSFIISFAPLPGKTFNGLRGVLTIHSNQYAVENVRAQPADDAALVIIKIQQKYELLDGHWFPLELNSEFVLKEQKVSEHPIKYVHHTYLSNAMINVPEHPAPHDFLNLEFAADANKKSEEFWRGVRVDSLSRREKNTYHLYDSMPLRTLALLNTFVKAAEAVAISKIKIGKFYIPMGSLVLNNGYEGLRVGAGIQTGEAISNVMTAEGYAAWGTKDKALKYGGSLQLNLYSKRETYLKISFASDLIEPGNSNFLKPPPAISSTQVVRNWLTSRMDSVKRIKLQFNFRPLRFSEGSIFIQGAHHEPTYDYSFQKSSELNLTKFTLTEAGVQFKFVAGEQISQVRNTKIITGFRYPMIDFSISRSFQNIFAGEFNFTKAEVKVDYQFRWKGFFKTTLQLGAGLVKGDAPYFSLFNGKGSNSGRFDLNSFMVPNHFQTMKIYEFTSDRFASFFLTHDFGRIVSTQSKYFRPELSLRQNIGFGKLSNREKHSLTLQTMQKGFYESGLALTNLLRINYVNLGYIGLGGGVFYRYGNYSLSDKSKNVVAKISVTFAL